MRNRRLIFALLFALALTPGLVAGQDDGFGVAVDVRRTAMNFDYPRDETQRTGTTRIGIALYETSVPWFQPGLTIGHLRTHQSNNPATQGMDPTGQYVGLRLHSRLFDGNRVGVHGRVAYSYFDSEDERDDLTTRLRWYETELGFGGHLHAGRFELAAGAFYRHIDGDQLTRGAEDVTRRIDGSATGPYLQVTYWTDATGLIAARYEAGDGYSAEITFARSF